MGRGTTSIVAAIVVAIAMLALPTASVAATTASLTWSSTGPLDTTPLGPDTHMQSVSCPQNGLCVAVDAGGNVLTSTTPTGGAATWQRCARRPWNLVGGDLLSDHIACVAGDGNGNLVISSDPTGGAGTWSKVSVTPGVVIDAVSCPTASFCLAGNEAGQSSRRLRPDRG